MQFTLGVVLVMALIMGLLIQHANAEKHSGLNTMVTSACIQQGEAAIENLIKQGVLDDKYESRTCEQVIKDLKHK
jgi:hypothetical protein